MSEDDSVVVEDIDVIATWEALTSKPSAQLIDVRTKAEWAFVGYPSLDRLRKSVIFIEWQSFPGKALNMRFSAELISELNARGAGSDAELYFLCRSGVRSLHAAKEMKQLGYVNCFNVAKGFEGSLDGDKHRGAADGWKAAKLPWVQG